MFPSTRFDDYQDRVIHMVFRGLYLDNRQSILMVITDRLAALTMSSTLRTNIRPFCRSTVPWFPAIQMLKLAHVTGRFGLKSRHALVVACSQYQSIMNDTYKCLCIHHTA